MLACSEIKNAAEVKIANARNFLNVDYLLFPSTISFLSRPIFALAYVILSIRLVYIKKLNDNYLSNQAKLIFKWIIFLVILSVILYLGFLLITFFSFYVADFHVFETKGDLALYATLGSLFLLNLSLLFFPNILYGLPQLDYAIATKRNRVEEEELGIVEDVKKQSKSFEISDERINLLKLKVDRYIQNKPYLNPDFNLTVMSMDTDIPVHHLSYYFNEHLHVNFNTWKNDLKINHVISLINNGSGEILTLDALAKQAGFGSRTSFFNSFKQKMGVTPSEYLNKLD